MTVYDHRQDHQRCRPAQAALRLRRCNRGRRAASIKYGHRSYPRSCLSSSAAFPRRRSDSRHSIAQGLRFRRCSEIADRAEMGLRIGGEHQRNLDDLRNRHEVGQRIVIDLRQLDIARNRAVRENDKCVAVGVTAHQVVNTDNGVGAGLVLHNDALSDPVLEIFRNDTGGEIDAAARWFVTMIPGISGREISPPAQVQRELQRREQRSATVSRGGSRTCAFLLRRQHVHVEPSLTGCHALNSRSRADRGPLTFVLSCIVPTEPICVTRRP